MNKKEFWVKNITNLRVSIKDLRLSIPPYAMINLMSKNYNLKEEELEKSLESGSLYAKRDKIKKREDLMTKVEEKFLIKEAKEKINRTKKMELSKKPIPAKEKSGYSLIEITEEVFDELNVEVDTEKFVEQFINDNEDE
jgi:hypothetical protein